MSFATARPESGDAVPAMPRGKTVPREGDIAEATVPGSGLPSGPGEPPGREAAAGRAAARFAAARPSSGDPGRSGDGTAAVAETAEARRG